MFAKIFNKADVLSAVTLLFFVFSLVSLHLVSAAARSYADQIIVADAKDAKELVVEHWLNNNVKGRALIQVSDNLPIEKVSEKNIEKILKDKKNIAEIINERNYLYIAIRLNIIRKIYGIVSDQRWDALKSNFETTGNNKVYRLRGDHLAGHVEGVPVTALPLSAFSPGNEKYLVNISSPDAALALRVTELSSKEQIKADIITYFNYGSQ